MPLLRLPLSSKIMDTVTIKLLIKIAEANLKVARREFSEIEKQGRVEDYEWEDQLEGAGNETYACEQVVRFLKANLERVSHLETK